MPSGSEFNKPEAGKKFVIVDVILVNQGKSTQSVSTMLQMSLKDETDQKYTTDLAAAIAADTRGPDGKILPGERVRGPVGFQVPQDTQGLVFVFDASVFGVGKAFVALGEKPVTIEPPAKLSGETPQTTHKVGEAIKIGDFVLTINKASISAGDGSTKPKPGKKFVVVDLTIENKGSKAAAISTMLQMFLKDGTGRYYATDLMAAVAAKGTSPDGELAAGEKIRGQVGYQVPEKVQGLTFVFDAELFGPEKALIQLP